MTAILPPVQEASVQSVHLGLFFDGQPLSTATGFAVGTAAGIFLITNRHNFTGRHQDTGECLSKTKAEPNRVVITYIDLHVTSRWLVHSENLLDSERQPLWFEHPTMGASADIAALHLRRRARIPTYSLVESRLREQAAKSPGTRLSVVGFPFGLKLEGGLAIWATGFMASEFAFDFEDRPVFLIDCRTRQGQSGSPVIIFRQAGESITMANGATVNRGGSFQEFLGIYSGRVNEESDLGRVWRRSAIIEMLDAAVHQLHRRPGAFYQAFSGP